ncbi:hypothetical protein PROFUN_05608 [Planoprotostelium fungivorum]|uniref:RRM domain-containing protein n=1 Tax=Planoprotostelium fungivorum TaxID=1890364 RepID=A0A2P6N094_9EUKA|nr:hypothetical protein PROFUN_05608 [Planoprotostelium fungivorum]
MSVRIANVEASCGSLISITTPYKQDLSMEQIQSLTTTPFDELQMLNSSKLDNHRRYFKVVLPKIWTNHTSASLTGHSRGMAFITYSHGRDFHAAYDATKHCLIDNKQIMVDFERERIVKGWIPRRLGGGIGGRKESGQLRFGGRDRPFKAPLLLPIPATAFQRFDVKTKKDKFAGKRYRKRHEGEIEDEKKKEIVRIETEMNRVERGGKRYILVIEKIGWRTEDITMMRREIMIDIGDTVMKRGDITMTHTNETVAVIHQSADEKKKEDIEMVTEDIKKRRQKKRR